MKFKGLSTSKIHLLGASMVCGLYVASPTAQAASNLGYIYGTMNFGGTVELLNSSNKVLGTLPKGVASNTPVSTIPVTIYANGPAYKVNSKVGTGGTLNPQVTLSQATTSGNTGNFSTIAAGVAVTSAKFINVINTATNGDITSQTVESIASPGILTWSIAPLNEYFSFTLTNLDSNVTYPGSNGTFGLGAHQANFEMNGEGTLNGYQVIGGKDVPFLATAATFNLSIPDSNVNLTNNGGFGDAIAISSLATVPLPAALFFVAPALAGVFGFSRRKNGSNATV